MEQLATVIDRTFQPPTSASTRQEAPHTAPDALRKRTLHDLVRRFEFEEAYENEDVTVPMRELRLSDEGHVAVPGLGAFQFTDWSRRQCASLTGLRWDRWFENASPGDRAEEMNRRFARANGSIRVRTRAFTDAATEAKPASSGWLRALVSPGYTPVRDSVVAGSLALALSAADEAPRVIRSDMTDRSTSFVISVGEPFRPGDSHEVGDVWGGLLVRNSGVGFASLLVTLHLTRLLCKNGMTAPVPDAMLLRRRHRGLHGHKLTELLADQMRGLPGRLREGADVLARSTEREVADPATELHAILDAANLPGRLLSALLTAYEREPAPTAFGVSQAVTLAAQSLTPEARVELERAAGLYVVSQEHA